MAKSLNEWISELQKQFEQTELEKDVAKAKITISLVDPRTGENQYHVLEYTAREYEQVTIERRG
jgi:phenylalanyl-tRNA synthetase alpha subunit